MFYSRSWAGVGLWQAVANSLIRRDQPRTCKLTIYPTTHHITQDVLMNKNYISNIILAFIFGLLASILSILNLINLTNCKILPHDYSTTKMQASNSVYNESSLLSFLKAIGYTKVPLVRLKSGYLCLPCRINEGGVLLAIDTASPSTRLDFTRFQMTYGAKRLYGNSLNQRLATIQSPLEISGFLSAPFNIHHLNLDFINTELLRKHNDTPIDGVIGLDFLRFYSTFIDVKSDCFFLRTDRTGVGEHSGMPQKRGRT